MLLVPGAIVQIVVEKSCHFTQGCGTRLSCAALTHITGFCLFTQRTGLNGWQIWCKLDALLPSPAHAAQGRQARKASKAQRMEHSHLVTKLIHLYTVGELCYTLYCGPKCNKKPQWVPAVVTEVFGTWSVNVCFFPSGPTWHQYINHVLTMGCEKTQIQERLECVLQNATTQRVEVMQQMQTLETIKLNNL